MTSIYKVDKLLEMQDLKCVKIGPSHLTVIGTYGTYLQALLIHAKVEVITFPQILLNQTTNDMRETTIELSND